MMSERILEPSSSVWAEQPELTVDPILEMDNMATKREQEWQFYYTLWIIKTRSLQLL